MFQSGFSVLLPFTVKDHIDINEMSTLYSDYLYHICDFTAVFFKGVIPMTEKIAFDGYYDLVEENRML